MPTSDVQKLGPVAVERIDGSRTTISKAGFAAVERYALPGIVTKIGPVALLHQLGRVQVTKIGAIVVIRPFEIGRRRPLYLDVASAAVRPVFAVEPFLASDTGFFAVGDTLTVAYTHDGARDTIQWTRAGLPILGATGLSYTLQPDDVGNVIRARVTAQSVVPTLTTIAQSPATSSIVTPVYAAEERIVEGGDTRVDSDGNIRSTGIERIS